MAHDHTHEGAHEHAHHHHGHSHDDGHHHAVSADAEATLPALIEAVKQLQKGSKAALKARGDKLAGFHKQAIARSKEAAAVGWDANPISTSRLCAELYDVIRNEKWGLTSGVTPLVSVRAMADAPALSSARTVAAEPLRLAR